MSLGIIFQAMDSIKAEHKYTIKEVGGDITSLNSPIWTDIAEWLISSRESKDGKSNLKYCSSCNTFFTKVTKGKKGHKPIIYLKSILKGSVEETKMELLSMLEKYGRRCEDNVLIPTYNRDHLDVEHLQHLTPFSEVSAQAKHSMQVERMRTEQRIYGKTFEVQVGEVLQKVLEYSKKQNVDSQLFQDLAANALNLHKAEIEESMLKKRGIDDDLSSSFE
jgi:hypothetical protein